MLAYVRAPSLPDLPQRQLCALLLIYQRTDLWTVRELAKAMNVSKPVITRAINTFEGWGWATRIADPSDKRSIFIGRTDKGLALVQNIRATLTEQT